MGISRLRALLEDMALEEDIQFTIPHPFLPPRFREICENQNMLLLVDQDLTIHVRWEGARMAEHYPLTKGATRRLIREVLRKMKEYRRDVEVYARFIEHHAEEPLDDERYEAIRGTKDPPLAEKEDEDDTKDEVVEIAATVALGTPAEMPASMGGSSPLPEWDY